MYKEQNYSEVGRGPIASEVKRNSQIAEQLEIQGKLVSELAAVIETLDTNLQTVSRSLPTAKESNIKQADQLVPLADTIRINNNHIISCIDNLRDMISELEL